MQEVPEGVYGEAETVQELRETLHGQPEADLRRPKL